MKVSEIMTHDVAACPSTASVAEAARIMWDRDCGIVPVTDPVTGRLCGVVTDRDALMAAMTQRQPIGEIMVASCMAHRVHHCRPDQDVDLALALMEKHAIRRLPVVDRRGRLTGMLSLNDLALAAARKGTGAARTLGQHVLRTMGAVCAHRVEPAEESALSGL